MPRIGQILCQSVPLTDHDVEEILHEQKTTRQPFGSVALSLGKAKPEQVWAAWLTQIRYQPIDLGRIKPDATALTALPANLAILYGLVPLRVRADDLVVACAGDLSPSAVAHVQAHCGLHLIVAHAPKPLVERALVKLYPAPAVTVA